MLDRMEEAELVSRVRSEEDRRVVKIYLGPKARDCKEQYKKVSEEMTDIYFKGFEENAV